MHISERITLKHSFRLALIAALMAAMLIGCTKVPTEPKTVTVLDPTEVSELTVSGRLNTGDRGRNISPDNKYLLTGIMGDEFDQMVALPISPDGEQSQEPIPLYSADRSWTRHNLLDMRPMGWLSNTECLFLIHGWQDQGPHKGNRGTAVYLGNIETAASSLLGYIDVPTQGELVEYAALTSNGRAYLRVGTRFWEFDVQDGEFRLIKDDLPAFHGLFHVSVSPTGDHVVYSVNHEDKKGVFIIDTATGEEIAALPTGDTISFYPAWSPDGKYISVYTARKVEELSTEDYTIYNFIPGEDAPRPSAEAITVLDTKGNIVKTITMDGQFLSHSAWLATGDSLVYLSGPVHFGKWGEVLSTEFVATWIEGLEADSEPTKVADVPQIEEQMEQDVIYAYPVASLPDGSGALLEFSGIDRGSIWRVSTENPPVKVGDGWWEGRLTPYFLDSVAGVLSGSEEAGLRLVGPENITEFGTAMPSGMTIAGYNSELLVVAGYDFEANETQVRVYKMLSERVQQ